VIRGFIDIVDNKKKTLFEWAIYTIHTLLRLL